MQDKKKIKIGSRIVALMGAIWLGMTKIVHASFLQDLQDFVAPQTLYGGPKVYKWYEILGNVIKLLWLPILIVVLFIIGITVYWRKSKENKTTKLISIILFLAIVAIIALIVWGCIYFYAG